MKKRFLTFGILTTIILLVVFLPTHFAYAGLGESIVNALLGAVARILIKLSSYVLLFAGMIFDWVVKYTIVEINDRIGKGTALGISISEAWKALRDLANMCFIFVLLFTAFKAMFQLNFSGAGTAIRNIVIVALLINFSLFFTRVVVDVSNVVSVGFYNNIVKGDNLTVSLGGDGKVEGISGGYMKMLRVSSLYNADILNLKYEKNGSTVKLDAGEIIVIGIMITAIILISSVILLVAGIMFAARFIILIFLMILSPLALIAIIIPNMRSQFEKWKNALIDQAFFAPIFFALTWVVFRVGNSLFPSIAGMQGLGEQSDSFVNIINKPGSTAALLVNYALIIGLSITALIVSKQMATKTAGFKMLAGGMGAGALGGAAWVGRKFVGGSLSAAANSGWLRDKAVEGKYGSKYLAKAGLALADKGSRASFDVRGLADTKVGKVVSAGKVFDITGKAGGEGGYRKWADKKKDSLVKADKERYGQTEEEKAEARKLEPEYNKQKFLTEQKIKNERLKRAETKLRNAAEGADRNRATLELEYVRNQNKKNIFTKEDYETFTPEWDTNKIKLDYERYANAEQRRMEARAKETESKFKNKGGIISKGIAGGTVGAMAAGPLGAAIGAFMGAGIGETKIRFNKSLAGKMRADTKKPSKEKQLAKIISEEFTEAPETPAAPSAPAEGGAPGGGTPAGDGAPTTP